MRHVAGSERKRPQGDAERAPETPTPVPDMLALQRAGVGNRALSRWLLQREPNFETAAAELGAIDEGAVSGSSPVTTAEYRAVDEQRRGALHEELLEEAPLGDPAAAIDTLETRRAKVEARQRESAQREGHAERRDADAKQRAELEAREVAAGTALTTAQAAAVKALAECTSLQKLHTSNPLWTEYETGSKQVLDDAKAMADAKAGDLASVKTDVKGARDGMTAALGLAAKLAALKQAEQVAADVAKLAADAADAVRPHKEAVEPYVTRASTRTVGTEREDLRTAALALGLPADAAAKVLRENIQASKGELQHRLTGVRKAYQSIAGPTLVTRVLGLGVTHAGANTCGIDNIGSVGGKRVHLTLYWDRVPQAEAGLISLNQSDDAILDQVLGTDATGCMHVTAEVYGRAANANPSYYWKGASKQMNAAAGTLGITGPELLAQLKALCDGKITDFKNAVAAKRTELGAKAP